MKKFGLPIISKIIILFIIVHTNDSATTLGKNKKKIPRPWEKFIKTEKESKTIYPKIQTIRLSNGIQVYYLKGSIVPKARLRIIIQGGLIEEVKEKIGLTELWGNSIVYSGSSKHTQEKLSSQLEDHASSFVFNNNTKFSSFGFTALSNFFEEDLKMILEVINNPRFKPKDVELIRKQKIQTIKKRRENPATLGKLGAHFIYWGSHPRGAFSTKKTISRIKHSDIKNWHEKVWLRSRIKVLLTGDININSIIKILNKYLIQNNKDQKTFDINDLESLMKVSSGFIKKKQGTTYHIYKQVPQSTIIWRAQGIPHHSKEYFALKIFNFILGGDSFNSFLAQDIRARRGWAYSVYSSYSSDKYGGYINIMAQTSNINVPSLMKRLQEILEKPEIFINKNKIKQAKKSIRNKFVFLYQTRFEFLNNIMMLKRHGLSDNYLSTFLKNIDQVSLNDVLKVARKYYTPHQFFKIIVAPKNLQLTEKVVNLKIPN